MAFNPRAPAGHLICKHLQCKEMFYESLVQTEPAGDFDDPDCRERNRYYWCLKSFRERGPDEAPCGANECTPERGCYER